MAALAAAEAFVSACGVHFDRRRARYAVHEILETVEEPVPELWTRAIVEVARTAGLHCRTIEASFKEVHDAVRSGAPAFAVVGPAGSESVCVLSQSDREKVQATLYSGVAAPRGVSPREVVRLAAESGRPKWTLGQATLPYRALGMSALTGGGKPPSPLRRAFALLRMERRDVALVAIFSLVVGGLALASPLAVEALVNTVAFSQFVQPLFVLSLMLLIFLGLGGVVRLVQIWVVELLQRRFFVRAVEDLAYRLPRVPSSVWREKYGPETANRFFDVVTVQKATATLLLDGIAILLQTLIGMVVLGFYHTFLIGFSLALLAGMAITIFALGAGGIRTAIKESKAKYGTAAWLQELARHPVLFRSSRGAGYAFDRADGLAVEWLHYRGDQFGVVLRQSAFAIALQAIALTALLGLGGWLVIQGQLSLGQLVAAELIIATIVGAFAKFGKHIESFYDLMAGTDKIGQLFDLPVEDQRLRVLPSLREPAAVQFSSPGLLDVRRYGDDSEEERTEERVLIEAGERIAIVGPAGSGKSRLVEALVGLRYADSGHVEIDGVDLRAVRPDSLREQAVLVGEPEIFAGTLEQNLAIAAPSGSYAKLRQALVDADLDEEVDALPQGLETPLLTDGVPLSRSQRIRLAIARAMLASPRLLVIDGTLDALPDETAERILRRLRDASNPWTLIVVTGRRDIERKFDRTLRTLRRPTPSGRANHASDSSSAVDLTHA
jgi:ABC-type bacteriocin/lantibiotic exporter with double-glycine peptidase domain